MSLSEPSLVKGAGTGVSARLRPIPVTLDRVLAEVRAKMPPPKNNKAGMFAPPRHDATGERSAALVEKLATRLRVVLYGTDAIIASPCRTADLRAIDL